MSTAAVLLALLSCLLAFFGVAELTQATTGVGLIALACLVAILSRLAQASGHHSALAAALTNAPKRDMSQL